MQAGWDSSTGDRTARPRDNVNPVVNDPFKALSHPIRRGIVERLAAGPATVGDATGGFGVSKPAISKHLKVLEETGVVTRVVEGRTHRLSLEPKVLDNKFYVRGVGTVREVTVKGPTERLELVSFHRG